MRSRGDIRFLYIVFFLISCKPFVHVSTYSLVQCKFMCYNFKSVITVHITVHSRSSYALTMEEKKSEMFFLCGVMN